MYTDKQLTLIRRIASYSRDCGRLPNEEGAAKDEVLRLPELWGAPATSRVVTGAVRVGLIDDSRLNGPGTWLELTAAARAMLATVRDEMNAEFDAAPAAVGAICPDCGGSGGGEGPHGCGVCGGQGEVYGEAADVPAAQAITEASEAGDLAAELARVGGPRNGCVVDFLHPDHGHRVGQVVRHRRNGELVIHFQRGVRGRNVNLPVSAVKRVLALPPTTVEAAVVHVEIGGEPVRVVTADELGPLVEGMHRQISLMSSGTVSVLPGGALLKVTIERRYCSCSARFELSESGGMLVVAGVPHGYWACGRAANTCYCPAHHLLPIPASGTLELAAECGLGWRVTTIDAGGMRHGYGGCVPIREQAAALPELPAVPRDLVPVVVAETADVVVLDMGELSAGEQELLEHVRAKAPQPIVVKNKDKMVLARALAEAGLVRVRETDKPVHRMFVSLPARVRS